jgi:hypothetical protein
MRAHLGGKYPAEHSGVIINLALATGVFWLRYRTGVDHFGLRFTALRVRFVPYLVGCCVRAKNLPGTSHFILPVHFSLPLRTRAIALSFLHHVTIEDHPRTV